MEAVPGQGELTARGSAADLHALQPTGAAREIWWLEVDSPALVLGSTQPASTVVTSPHVEVVHRRSGGGAVLMLPGEVVWVDVIVPRDDPLWDDDVGRAMWWLGDAWERSLRAVGVDDVSVHRGPLVTTQWSRLVCFDGLGAGEVTVGRRKAVGISQRRTRNWARMQSLVHLSWRPDVLVDLLSPPRPTAAELAAVWCLPPGVAVAALREALTEAIAAA